MNLTSSNYHRSVFQGALALSAVAKGSSTAWPLAASDFGDADGWVKLPLWLFTARPPATASLAPLALLAVNNGNADVLFRLGQNDNVVVTPSCGGTHRVKARRITILDEAEMGALTASYVAVISANGKPTKITFYRAAANKMALPDVRSLDTAGLIDAAGDLFSQID